MYRTCTVARAGAAAVPPDGCRRTEVIAGLTFAGRAEPGPLAARGAWATSLGGGTEPEVPNPPITTAPFPAPRIGATRPPTVPAAQGRRGQVNPRQCRWELSRAFRADPGPGAEAARHG
jgi:hypothetical protein